MIEPQFIQITDDQISRTWPKIERFFKRACDRVPTHLTPELILHRAETKQCDLWVIYDENEPLPLLGAAATCLRDEPEGTVLTIESIGGEKIIEWKHLFPRFEKLAKDHGVAMIEIEGRPGWQRFLKDYELRRVVVGKRL